MCLKGQVDLSLNCKLMCTRCVVMVWNALFNTFEH